MSRSQFKPLPAGTRLVPTCLDCGRRIRQSEHVALIWPPPQCTCGSRMRKWERCPPTLLSRLLAWFAMRAWNLERGQR